MFKLLLGLLISCSAQAQQTVYTNYLGLQPGALPSLCNQGAVAFSSGSSTLNVCSSTNNWTAFSVSSTAPMNTPGQMIYENSSFVPAALNIGMSGQILTVSGGYPAWANGFTNPLTTTGDLIYSSSGSTPGRLGIGSSSSVLTVVSGAPAWAAAPTPSYPLSLSNGGFGISNGSSTAALNSISPMSTPGDLIYENASYLPTRLGIGSSTNLLTVSGGIPAWEAIPTWNQNTSGTAAGLSSILVNTSGGTGQGSAFNQYGVTYGATTTTLGTTAAGTAGNPFIAGSPPSFSSVPTIASIIDTSNVLNIEDSSTSSKVLAFNVSNNSSSTTLTLEPTQTTSQILKFPNITAGDSVATLGLAQTFSAVDTFSSAPIFSSVTVSQALTVNGSKALTSNAFSSTPGASTIAEWDANKNISFDNDIPAGASTATAAGTTALVVGSNHYQFFTGTTTQTVTLPVVSGLAQGQGFDIVNLSTGVVTVESSGANVIQAMAANTILRLICINTSGGTGIASWTWNYSSVQGSLPAGFSGLTTDGVIYATSASAIASTAVGSSGSVLTSNSTGNAPTWQAAPSAATGSYAQAYFGLSAVWSTSSASYADPTFSGTAGFTVRKNSGITLTAGGSNVPGITFTPPSASAVYLIIATIPCFSSASLGMNVQLTDGTTVINGAGLFQQATTIANVFATTTLAGIYAPASTNAVTVKVQMAAGGGGTATIEGGTSTAGASLGDALEFTVIRIF